MTLTVVFALAAAFSSTVNLMTQHSASVGAPKREKGWRLVAYLFRQPPWLLGWIVAVGGFAFQAVALHYGQLSVVQPILVTELIFVLVLRRVWIRQDTARDLMPLSPASGVTVVHNGARRVGHSLRTTASIRDITAARPVVMDGNRGQEHAMARVGDHFAVARIDRRTGAEGRRRWLSIRGRYADWMPPRLSRR